MKLKLKKICNKIKSFIDKHKSIIKLVIVELSIIIIFTLGVICGYYSNQSNESDYDNIELCSMTTNNTAEDFNKTYSDFICLSAPILKIGSSPYRCIGSIFLGYEGDNCYLYYPVAYIKDNQRAYEYRRQLCDYYGTYDISLAVQSTIYSDVPKNTSFRFTIDRGEHFTTLIKQDIYETDFFDYHCFIDTIGPLDNTLIGYTTVSDYYCYGGIGDYRYRLRLYNIGNLLEDPNNYNITDRYNPCLHFNDFSGYNNGYNNGYAYGYGIGEQKGEEYGMQVGYDKGYSEGVTSDGLFGFLSSSVSNLLDIEIFPSFSIGDAFWIGIGIVLFGVFMKIFRF